MVLTLGGSGISFSKRISSTEEKERILNAINNIDGYGITIRTEAVHASDEDLLAEKISLLSELEVIIKKLRYSLKLGKVYGENIILNKVIRENLGNECKIILNHEEDLNEVKSLLEDNDKVNIEKFNNTRSLFDYYGIEKGNLKIKT